MKKNYLLITSVAIATLAVGVTAIGNSHATLLKGTDEQMHTLVMNHDNVPENLTSDFQPVLINDSIKTVNGNDIPLTFALAKTNASGFCTLGNHGKIYNFGAELGRFKGIYSITAEFTSGSLKFEAGNYELQNGGAYLDQSFDLTSGKEYVLSQPARYFSLSAGDANVPITSITINYSCDGNASEFVEGQTYVVEDFNSYTDTGVGWDQGHSYHSTTQLRSAFYSTYFGSDLANVSQTIQGNNWTLMGGNYDYMYIGAGRTGSAALMKINNGNSFRYIQSKAAFGVQSFIGKGNQLSVWMHGAYAGYSAPYTASSQNIIARIFAFAYAKFDTTGANTADIAEYIIPAGSEWTEYKLDLDPNKEYYSYGIAFTRKSTTATAYVPVDDVTIKTVDKSRTAPSGTFTTRISGTIPVAVSFADKVNKVAVWINNKDATATGYTYNAGTKAFSITTTGKYDGKYTYGNVNGTYDPVNDELTNVTLTGQVSAMFSGPYSLSRPAKYYDCDGDNINLRSTFTRRYYDGNNWISDPGNADQLVANIFTPAAGVSSLSPRNHATYRTGISLTSFISDTTSDNFSLWFYNPSESNVAIKFAVYKTENITSTADADRYVFADDISFAPGWTFWLCGFGNKTTFVIGSVTLRNFMINIPASTVRFGIDCIGIYH